MANRKHLFKGKRIDNGEWIEGGGLLTCKDGGAFIVAADSKLFQASETAIALDGALEVDPDTVCEYTGRNDKNGKEIFEHYVVMVDNGIGYLAEIVWQNEGYYILPKGRGGTDIPLSRYSSQELEVVGNIFDNPELLEGKGNG